MPSSVTINNCNSSELTTVQEVKHITVVNPQEPRITVVFYQDKVITVRVPGPQGPQGEPGISPSMDGYVTTSSFNSFTGSYNTGSFTGSFIGDGSGLFGISASAVEGLNLEQIASGNVTASVSANPESLFLIKSASVELLRIKSTSQVDILSNNLTVTNPSTNQPVFNISGSLVGIATQSSVPPTGEVVPGYFWLTPTDLYISLE